VDLRPEEKVLLISGPPGLGKTTLVKVPFHTCTPARLYPLFPSATREVHRFAQACPALPNQIHRTNKNIKVAARHMGYNVVEVNASDDRTGKVLRERIINAMEMRFAILFVHF
jgi:DNA polymerase III delta prime subunit